MPLKLRFIHEFQCCFWNLLSIVKSVNESHTQVQKKAKIKKAIFRYSFAFLMLPPIMNGTECWEGERGKNMNWGVVQLYDQSIYLLVGELPFLEQPFFRSITNQRDKRIWRCWVRRVPLKSEYWTRSAAKLIKLPFVASDMEIKKNQHFLLRFREVFDHLGKNEVWFLDIFQNLSANGEAMFNCIMETRKKFWHPTHQSNCFFISPLSWKDSKV